MHSILMCFLGVLCFFFFFQAEDGIRDLVRSRGLGDVYKRQIVLFMFYNWDPTIVVNTDFAFSLINIDSNNV